MMKDRTILITVVIVLIVAVAAVGGLWYASKAKADQAKYSAKGWLQSLFNNGADILDSAGRLTTSPITATGNAISSIIATSKSDGRGVMAQYGYSDKPQANYGPWIVAGSVVVLAGIVIIAKD